MIEDQFLQASRPAARHNGVNGRDDSDHRGRNGRCGETFVFGRLPTPQTPSGRHLRRKANQPDQWWVEMMKTTVERPRGELWIAWVHGEAVGMLLGRVDRELPALEIGAMWVARRGVTRRYRFRV